MLHDACGVGFIADLRRRPTNAVVAYGLTALRRLAHRGASPELGAVDGCGLLTAIPWTLIAAAFGDRLPAGRARAAGMVFVHPDTADAVRRIVECELRAAGAAGVAWRPVPIDASAVLPAQRSSAPLALQVVAGFRCGSRAAETKVYRARLAAERALLAAGVGATIVSLSTATIVHKGLVTPDALDRFYPELADSRFVSPFVVFHQRFSTNTSADWALAQPFRTVAHNGEINTVAGNRLWMRARLADASSLPGFDGLAPISSHGSDSQSLDDAVEMLRHHGYSIAHALARVVPPSWERDQELPPDLLAFHQFQALLSEPWDGPSALAFADGRFVGAALDRNGFRPARTVTTADGLVAVASEVGVLAADEHSIVDRGRLGPGEILVVDLERGAVMKTAEVRRRLAKRRDYRQLIANTILDATAPGPSPRSVGSGIDAGAPLSRRQCAFGCTREEIELLLKPMIADGHEAVGSMGDDAPPAVLSQRPRLFSDYFRQRFAQVTNPPVDPYREASVMSLTTILGGHGSFLDELAPRPGRIVLRSPVLTAEQLDALAGPQAMLPSVAIDTSFAAADGLRGFERHLETIAESACAAVERGSAVVVLTDRAVCEDRAALPALLATAAVHHALVRRGVRMRCSLVVETGDVRDAHQLAVLCAYGASAVCPTLGYDTVAAIAPDDSTGLGIAAARYRLALERGLLTSMSKMGVCTFSGYCGAQLFEVIGIDQAVIDAFFPGTASPLGGVTLERLAQGVLDRHQRAFAAAEPRLEYPGLHTYRRDGEYHATNPQVVRSLHRVRDEGAAAYETFKAHVHNRPPSAVRDLLEFVPAAQPVPLDAVESAESICRRFFASAMSVGALSPEAHRVIARAMNRLGARSNSGEGGEEPDRFGHADGNRTKQVASARFGVTPAYLRSADELQIKIAQGSKPGEGGQLPAIKVVPHIARLRHAQPGTTLISPPVHHDIYSIEDLAQLIFDLRTFHPAARINVKLVASTGVGVIAAGVAKAGADAIQISGHDGGTGASPRASIKHAGMPWEIGLSEAHRTLVRSGLRQRVVLQTDGGLKTGRDVAVAAALGADEYGFGTAALVALGCVMARQCHANTCPVGIATQREDLRLAFEGTPEMLIGYLTLVAGELREILARLGLTRVADLVGRVDLLRQRDARGMPLTLDAIVCGTPAAGRAADAAGHYKSAGTSVWSLDEGPIAITRRVKNTDRAVGADIAGAIAERYGDAGLADGSVRLTLTGSAGQSFGAFSLPGMHLSLVGDANDGVGKGMHGGEIVIGPAARERGRVRQVLVGNAALYGATGGRLFVAGAAGERFAVRNSGATAVVEGAGDHACEYMTGGTVAILGSIGRNFAAGMTGGVVFALDRRRALAVRLDSRFVAADALTLADRKVLHDLLEAHERLTGSRVARTILRHDPAFSSFVRVAPIAAVAQDAPVEENRAVNE